MDDKRSGWTVDTILALMNERDLRYAQRFSEQEKALAVAEKHAEHWREQANEWRSTMTDRERTFFPRSMGMVSILVGIAAAALAVIGHFK